MINRDVMRKALLMQIRSLATLAAQRDPDLAFPYTDEEWDHVPLEELKLLRNNLHEIVYAPPVR